MYIISEDSLHFVVFSPAFFHSSPGMTAVGFFSFTNRICSKSFPNLVPLDSSLQLNEEGFSSTFPASAWERLECILASFPLGLLKDFRHVFDPLAGFTVKAIGILSGSSLKESVP